MRTGESLWIVVVVCSVAVVYAWWRIRLWRSRFSRSRALLPHPSHLSWKVPASDRRTAQFPYDETSAPRRSRGASREKRDSEKRKRLPSAPPGPDNLAAAEPAAAAALASVDPGVFRAIQASTAEQLRSVDSISDYVHANFHDISATSAESWMQRLEDHVAGDSSALAKAGRAIQRRNGGAKEAVTHLRTAVKTKAHMVHGLADFDHDAITTASKDAISVVHEGFDLGLHIPLGTLLRSSWRELELLFAKKVPIERAVKHIAMDVASVGTGAFVGAKVGGGIGAIGGPVGVGAGVLVGAMAGAIAGRGLAHKSRMAPFNKAYERYEVILNSARSAVDTALMESKAEVKELESSCQARFEAARNQVESDARQKLDEIERRQVENLERFLRKFPTHLSALEAQLLREEAAVLSEMPVTHWWNRIFPRRQDLEKSVVRQWFKSTRKTIRKERRRFEKLKRGPAAPLYSKVHRFLTNYTFSLRSFDEDLAALANQFAEARAAAQTVNQTALRQAENARDQVLVDFRERTSKIFLVLCQTISSWKDKVQLSLDELRRQARPLGVELPD